MHVSPPRSNFPLSLIFILSGILLLFAACGPNTPTVEPATPQADANAKGKVLTLWHTFGDKRADTLKQLAQQFHNVYPDLTVNTVYVGSRDDLTRQMTAAIALGSAPDLVLADRRQIAEFAAQGGLLPLDSFLDDAELGFTKQERTDFLNGALSLGKFPELGSRTYGFPFYQEAFVLYYNADLMKGLNVNRAPQTWEQFGEFAGNVPQPQYGWAMRADAATFEAMLVSQGSALLTDAETRALFNERAGLKSLKLVADLSEGDIARLATSDDNARREFGTGSAAFYLGWMSELPALQFAEKNARQNFAIGVGILPQLDPAAPWLLTRGDLFGIARVPAERARDAWFFIRWITAPTQSARWVRETDALPLALSTLNFVSSDRSSSIFYKQIFQDFKSAPPRLAPQPAPLHIDTVEEMVSGLWLQAVQPKPDLPALLDAMAARVNQILAIQP